MTVHREHSVKREKTNKMQQSDVYYQLLSQHVSAIIMPIYRRTKTVCYCIWCTALVLLDVVDSGCGAMRCRMRASDCCILLVFSLFTLCYLRLWHTKIDPQFTPVHKNNFHKTGERFEGWGKVYVMFCFTEIFSLG